MEKLDRVVADHIEQRLLQPKRLEEILSSVLQRREERAERRTTHIAELRKRASETDAKLKRLYDAIENGIADLSDPMLRDRVGELKAIRDQARADAERAQNTIERLGPSITPQALKTFAGQARKRMRTESGGYRRDHLRALALPSAKKSTRRKFASWGPKAYCCVHSSPLQAQKRRVLAFPVLYRSGAPDRIRTCDLCLRRAALYPAELRAREAVK
jgi:hypothetical protein